MTRARATVLAIALALVAALATPPAAAGAQSPGIPSPTTAPAPPSGPRIALAAQDPWTPVGGDVNVALDVADAPPGATVSFTAYQALTSRKHYDAVVVGGPLSTVLSQVSVPLELLPTDGSGARTVQLGLQSPTVANDATRLNIRRPGVYPLEVDLRDADDQRLSTFLTLLVVSEPDRASVAEPLRVAWVWPVTAPPSYLPDGDPDREVAASFRGDGRLGRQALALRAVADVPVTLAPTGETLEAWADTARSDPSAQTTLDALHAGTANRAVLDGPYVPIDLPALLDHGLSIAADDVLQRGRDALGTAVATVATVTTVVDRRTRLLRPASSAALGRLHAGGVDRVIVPAEAIAPAPETRFTLAQPVTLAAPLSGGATAPVEALVTDPGLQGVLTADLPAAQRVQLLLGGLALVALETPAIPRVVTLVNPDDFDAPAALTQGLLTGLRNNPFVRPVTTAEAFDTVPADPPAPTVTANAATSARELTVVATPEPAITEGAYRNQRSRLHSFGALTRPGDPAVADGDRALLAAVASGWPIDIGKARAEAHLQVVDQVIDSLVSRIEVADPRTITLTSRSGEIPLTFRNDTGFPVHLRAVLASEKLFFPDGSVVDLVLPPKSTTVRVAVEARTSGTFPLDLEVTSTDGVLSISQRRLEVRSTFVSTVGVVLMASAVAFLALWWGLDLRRRRRRRQSSTT